MRESGAAGAVVRRRELWVMVVLALALVLIGCGLFLKRELEEISYCSSPPTRQQEAVQQAFVLAHVRDARGFEWQTSDCDDQGASVLTYRTSLSQAEAIELFRADPGCAAATWTDDPDTLVCESGGTRVEVGFAQLDEGRTEGYVGWDDRGVDR